MIRSYSYPINRHIFVWLPVMPFSRVSALTPSEWDAPHAAAARFFYDFAKDSRSAFAGH
jgi:hypothetical protein